MENVATVEQAEPQGSAASDVVASPPERATPPSRPSVADISSRDLLRRGIEARSASRSGETSTTQETSATDEQPASDASPARDAEASKTGTDQPTDPEQPRLSRAERKALKTAQTETAPATPAQPSADTSAASPASEPDDRIERVERTLTDALSRIESRLPAQAEPAAPAPSTEDVERYGDDAEFFRLATIATRPGTTGEFLGNEDLAKLERWSLNREERDRTARAAELTYRSNQTDIALAAAEAHGIDKADLFSAPTMRAIYDRFVDQGRALERTESAAKHAESAAEIKRLKDVNQQLADDLDAYEQRAPGLARQLVGGGMSGQSRVAHAEDRARLSGTQQIRAALAAGPSKRRPGGRGAR